MKSWNATRKAKQKRTLQLFRREKKACVSSKDYLGKLAGSAALDLGALSQIENSVDRAVGRIWAGQRLTTGVYGDKEYMEMEWELGGEVNELPIAIQNFVKVITGHLEGIIYISIYTFPLCRRSLLLLMRHLTQRELRSIACK